LGGRTQCHTVIQPMIRRKDPTSVLDMLSSMGCGPQVFNNRWVK
jgi:hypothetical protein